MRLGKPEPENWYTSFFYAVVQEIDHGLIRLRPICAWLFNNYAAVLLLCASERNKLLSNFELEKSLPPYAESYFFRQGDRPRAIFTYGWWRFGLRSISCLGFLRYMEGPRAIFTYGWWRFGLRSISCLLDSKTLSRARGILNCQDIHVRIDQGVFITSYYYLILFKL
jgi:hypothetical protein